MPGLLSANHLLFMGNPLFTQDLKEGKAIFRGNLDKQILNTCWAARGYHSDVNSGC